MVGGNSSVAFSALRLPLFFVLRANTIHLVGLQYQEVLCTVVYAGNESQDCKEVSATWSITSA
jgi:hypothetical protein